jgi:hypothetical protein
MTILREGGVDGTTRFDALSRVIGHWLRLVHEGARSMEQAIERIFDYNQACLRPPRPLDELQKDVERLWDKHVKDNGPPKPLQETSPQEAALQALDLTRWAGLPPKRQWIIKDWLPKGCVTALYGDGGVGKSLLAQQLMTSVATGAPWLERRVEKGRVYGLMCEDDEDELWRRQHAINQLYGLAMEDLGAMRLLSRVGDNNLLMTFDGKDTGRLTPFFEALHADILAFKPDLVVLDTAADIFGGNEIYRTHVRQFIQNACARIARDTQGAVLLCAHPSDSGIQRGTGTGGSTAWNNTVRSRLYLTRPDDNDKEFDVRLLARKKANYAARDEELRVCWHKGAFILRQEDASPLNAYGTGVDPETARRYDAIIDLIRQGAYEGTVYTALQFAKHFNGQGDLGKERSIREIINSLASLGYIKFFRACEGYGLAAPRSPHGFLCVKDMKLKLAQGKSDEQTGRPPSDYCSIQPSHEMCPQEGTLKPVTNPDVWTLYEPLKQRKKEPRI